jgi:hypothetical protein
VSTLYSPVIARLDRTIQYAETSPYKSNISGILDHPLSRVDDGGL